MSVTIFGNRRPHSLHNRPFPGLRQQLHLIKILMRKKESRRMIGCLKKGTLFCAAFSWQELQQLMTGIVEYAVNIPIFKQNIM